MREIKFREWETERKTLIVGKREDYDDSIGFRFAHEEGGERILMQYTGLKDKNGVEIYEGDILNYGDYSQSHEVIFKNGCFWGHAIGCGENIGIGLYNALEDLEIAGNIYDNPELLEVAK